MEQQVEDGELVGSMYGVLKNKNYVSSSRTVVS